MTPHDAFTRFARVFPEAVLLVTPSGVIRAANPACAAVFHTATVEGRPLAELACTSPDELAEYLRLCSRNRQFVLGALSVADVDGTPVPYRCEGALVADPPAEEPLIALRLRRRVESAGRFIALTHEVDQLRTEIRRRQAVEEALRASDAFSRSILDSTADCVKVLDLDGRLLSMNEPGTRALGIDDITPHLNSSWIEFWTGADRAAARQAVEAALQGGTGKFIGCFPVAGEPRWWDVIVTPIADAAGRPIRLLSVSRDVTDQRRLEDERAQLLHREQLARASAETANALKDQFLATVSHELRTPLNAILGWAHILRGGRIDAAGVARALETIDRNAQMQALLIEDLLDVSRITTGNLRLHPRRVAFVDLVQKALDVVRPAAENKRVSVTMETDDSSIAIHGDPDRLQQIVWNLLTNAVKFTPEHGQVRVRLARRDSQATLEITDTGQGFPADLRPHLFEPFRQADASSTRMHGGLGLGLTIAKQLVEAHGGTIRGESAGRDRGAVFTVTLPLAAGEVDAPLPPALLPGGAVDLAGLRVLVVDDQRDARELLRVVLEQSRAEVTLAASAAEALDAVRQQQPDVLLADIAMPEQDGYALIRAVRRAEQGSGRYLPVIAVTAYASLSDRDRALRAGFDAHVVKPVDPEQLARTIRAFTLAS